MDKYVSNGQKAAKDGEKIRMLRRKEEAAHFDMLNLCYNPWGSEEEWRRKYVLYPGFETTENVLVLERNGEWAGGGTAWFREALLKSEKKIVVYCAGDLYVHPAHRGRGVYSAAMRGLNQLAQKKGSVLGFAFPAIYRLPAIALPRYGFVEVFRPMTHVFVVKPEKFFEFLISRAKKAYLPSKFNGIKLKLTVSFDTPKGKQVVTDTFQVEEGQISESEEQPDRGHVDLAIKTEISVLLKIVSSLYLGKGALIISLLAALLRGRVRLRFSTRFVRSFLGM